MSVNVVADTTKHRRTVHGASEFISATWEMLEADYTEVTWSQGGTAIAVKNPERLAAQVLPQYFRRGAAYASWIRMLNAYGFRRAGRGEWAQPNFRRDKPELLKDITRAPKASSKGGAKATGAATPNLTALAALLHEERSKLAYMRQEMERLEEEVAAAHQQEAQVKEDAVRYAQQAASEIRAFAPPPMAPELCRLASACKGGEEGCCEGLGGLCCPVADGPLAGVCRDMGDMMALADTLLCPTEGLGGLSEECLQREYARLQSEHECLGCYHRAMCADGGCASGKDAAAACEKVQARCKEAEAAGLEELAAGLDLDALAAEPDAAQSPAVP